MGEPHTLRDVLQQFDSVTAPAGATKSKIDRQALKERLDVVERRCQQQYIIWLSILAIAFIFAVLVVWLLLDNPKHAVAVIGATGFTVGTILPKLRQVEREISRIRLFSALVVSVSDDQLPPMVKVLVNKL
ncbi:MULTISPECIES: hypothetical protein [Bradyrhizobium]|uniref:hypothetical protein n=1 Tax=Bradyrhizobium TaxID=374 RepID=UPI0004B47C72|nr:MULTISPECIES: hypothetical protein [Bradyrhizobium]MCA1431162.1 hypothetical protein [Bradyrhizobium sp. NBAIM16]MCA1509060.1 hypothetical protein [Bradyrhizobium sp. NBAIM02]